MAATEFGVSQQTIATGLKGQGIAVVKGKTYTTREIASAIFNDQKKERARVARVTADRMELKLRMEAGEMFDKALILKREAEIMGFVRQQITELPNRESSNCNPENPGLPRSALRKWADGFLAATAKYVNAK